MKPLISKCSMIPGWHQLVPISGHVEESETARKLQLYATSIKTSVSTRLVCSNWPLGLASYYGYVFIAANYWFRSLKSLVTNKQTKRTNKQTTKQTNKQTNKHPKSNRKQTIKMPKTIKNIMNIRLFPMINVCPLYYQMLIVINKKLKV